MGVAIRTEHEYAILQLHRTTGKLAKDRPMSRESASACLNVLVCEVHYKYERSIPLCDYIRIAAFLHNQFLMTNQLNPKHEEAHSATVIVGISIAVQIFCPSYKGIFLKTLSSFP